ncbi:uncharacterized protein LOC126657082 [Mercurialis annua]|uniref:uncharacterized protein LOC126657082 n=1 Tax=Mercurialis annua TaxID=3986 RepID=UPI00215FF709|nr:uncharacterized protein LOC126657082 [Mercurialis annua]
MFLAAVARPRIDTNSGQSFDGKIGIWPFMFKEPAKRTSKNRVAGTMETKPILSVTKVDNARPHLNVNDLQFNEVAGIDNFDIQLCFQAPNSHDMNVLDLGFFRAIDALQQKKAPTTIGEFVAAVEKAYEEFSDEEINNIFLTLQGCMLEVMKDFGGNNYKVPHMNKHKLIRDGQLPQNLECSDEILNQTRRALHIE